MYCGNNPVAFVDPTGLENIVVAGGAYHEGNGAYQYTFVDCALLQIKKMGGDATLLVANAGWTTEQVEAINNVAQESNIKLIWFNNSDELVNYINNGSDDNDRSLNLIESFYVFAHGTDSGTGYYNITFGLYTNKNDQFKLGVGDIDKINESKTFETDSQTYFYACRTGNNFESGNFAQRWANRTGSETWAFYGVNGNVNYGRSDYKDILGTWFERHILKASLKTWKNQRGNITERPGASYALPKPSTKTRMKAFTKE